MQTNANSAGMTNAVVVGISKNFWEIQQKLVRAQQGCCTENEQEQLAAYKNFVNAVGSLQEETQKRLGELHGNYSATLRSSSDQDNVKRTQDAYQNYSDSLQRTYEESFQRYQQTYEDYLTTLQRVQSSNREKGLQNYRAYLQDLKDAWAQLDIDAVMNSLGAGSDSGSAENHTV